MDEALRLGMPVECLPIEYLQQHPTGLTDHVHVPSTPCVRPKALSITDQPPKHAIEDKKEEPEAKSQKIAIEDKKEDESYENYDEEQKAKIKELFRKSAALAFQNLSGSCSTASSSTETAKALTDTPEDIN